MKEIHSFFFFFSFSATIVSYRNNSFFLRNSENREKDEEMRSIAISFIILRSSHGIILWLFWGTHILKALPRRLRWESNDDFSLLGPGQFHEFPLVLRLLLYSSSLFIGGARLKVRVFLSFRTRGLWLNLIVRLHSQKGEPFEQTRSREKRVVVGRETLLHLKRLFPSSKLRKSVIKVGWRGLVFLYWKFKSCPITLVEII